jgi:ABC-2 type transport system ATP-binding protein
VSVHDAENAATSTAPAATPARAAQPAASAWLALEQVSYRYGRGKDVLSGLNLELPPGIVGLLGPNGAGKSTLMRLLATLARPSEGRILWQGVDTARQPDALRRTLGYLPQEFGVYPALSAREFLEYIAAVKGLPRDRTSARVDHCLAQVGLTDVAARPLGEFSGGMRQRVGIAQALLNDPQLLIVDEPTVGLDPEERLRFRSLLTELASDRLVILSTHIVSDVEASAGLLVVLEGGRLRYHGSAEKLMARAQGQVWDWVVPAAQIPQLRNEYHVSAAMHRVDGVQLRVVAEGAPSADAVPAQPTLEDAYLLLRSGLGGA